MSYERCGRPYLCNRLLTIGLALTVAMMVMSFSVKADSSRNSNFDTRTDRFLNRPLPPSMLLDKPDGKKSDPSEPGNEDQTKKTKRPVPGSIQSLEPGISEGGIKKDNR